MRGRSPVGPRHENASRGAKVVFGGLMTMPPFTEDPEEVRSYFAQLRSLRERLRGQWGGRHDFSELSMGTSQDFEVAVQEGATIVRLGGVLYR
jgi:PLP dependent protein